MARKRMIDPTFWEDEKLGTMLVECRLLFMGLISQADDDGRLRGNPALIRSLIFPYDDGLTAATVDEWLSCLHNNGLILRYSVDDERYIWIINFDKHQTINKPTPSKLPGPPDIHIKEEASSDPDALPDDYRSPTVALPPNRKEEKRREDATNVATASRGRGKPKSTPDTVPRSQSPPFDLFVAFCDEMQADPAEVDARTKGKQCKAAERLLAAGHSEEDMRRFVRYLRSQEWRSSPIDLMTVESEIGKWKLNGAPETEQTAKQRNRPKAREDYLWEQALGSKP